MTDRELLELSAKAAGIDGYFDSSDQGERDEYWSPLTDDGDALRLAVKLRLQMYQMDSVGEVDGVTEKTPVIFVDCKEGRIYQYLDGDPYAATRRAIVRAAAVIGANA